MPSVFIVGNDLIETDELEKILATIGYDLVVRYNSVEETLHESEPATPDLLVLNTLLGPGKTDRDTPLAPSNFSLNAPIVSPLGWLGLGIADTIEPDGTPPISRHIPTPGELKALIDAATLKHRATRRLDESVERYRLLFENAPLPYQSLDEDGRFLEVNQTWLEMLGYERGDVIGSRFADLITAESRNRFKRCFADFKAVGEIHRVEYEMIKGDGSTLIASFDGCIVRDLSGRFMQTHCIMHDVTGLKIAEEARHKAEAALRKSEAKYRLLFDNAPIGIGSIDAAGNLIEMNPKLREILGLHENRTPAANIMRDRLVLDHDGISEACRQCMQTAQPVTVEGIYTAPSGRKKHVRIMLTCLSERSDENRGCQVVIEDITERKEIEKAVEEKSNLLESVWRTSPVGMALACDRVFSWVNDRWCEMFRHDDPVDVIGKQTSVGYASDEEFERVGRALYTGLDSTGVTETDARFKRKDGSLFHGHIWTTYLDPNDRSKGAIAAIVDITDRKEAQDRISESLREKEVLLREIHHRVKNNLAVVHALLGMQAEYLTDESHRSMFENSRQRIRSMALAHELLYQSESLSAIRIDDYVGRLVDHLTGSIAGIGAPVTITRDIDEAAFGLETAVPLGLIVVELVSNALKHAFPDEKEGRVHVCLRRDNDDYFMLTITDNGIGLPEAMDFTTGVSLGLDLVDTFVQQLHGTMEVDRSNGTQIRIRFEDRVCAKKPVPPDATAAAETTNRVTR